MASKLVITTWLLAVSTIYVASFQISGYGQLAINPVGECVDVDCQEIDDGVTECDRHWIVDDAKENDTYKFRNTEALNIYEAINAKGETTGITLKIKEKESVTKITITGNDGKIKRISCITKTKEPTDEEEQMLKEFCNENGMQRIDQGNCN